MNHTTGFGATILAKYGYNVGEGLGKKKCGIVTPIQPKKQLNRAGLGIILDLDLLSHAHRTCFFSFSWKCQ